MTNYAKSIKHELSRLYLQGIGSLPNKTEGLASNFDATIQSLDVSKIVKGMEDSYKERLAIAIASENPKSLLEICRGKHLLPKLATELGLKDKKSLISKILNAIDQDQEFSSVIQDELPKLSNLDTAISK